MQNDQINEEKLEGLENDANLNYRKCNAKLGKLLNAETLMKAIDYLGHSFGLLLAQACQVSWWSNLWKKSGEGVKKIRNVLLKFIKKERKGNGAIKSYDELIDGCQVAMRGAKTSLKENIPLLDDGWIEYMAGLFLTTAVGSGDIDKRVSQTCKNLFNKQKRLYWCLSGAAAKKEWMDKQPTDEISKDQWALQQKKIRDKYVEYIEKLRKSIKQYYMDYINKFKKEKI